MWLMLQQDEPDDYVIATGVQYSVKDFIKAAAPFFGFTIDFRWSNGGEVGYCKSLARDIIKTDPKYFRPSEVESLLGDPSKAKEKLGWEPTITFDQLVEDMCIYGQ